MKIPKKLKIGGHIVSIKLGNLGGDNGLSDFSKNEIHLSRDLPPSQKEATLIHEIFHFLNSTLDEKPYAHELLDSLSEQFYQVLKQNNLLK